LLVLKHGRVVFDGDIDAAVEFYESEDYQAIELPAGGGAGRGTEGAQ